MQVYQKRLMDQFFTTIQKDFKKYCEQHHTQIDSENFLTFLYDLNLLNENTIRRYTILEEYDKMHTLPTFKKTKVVRLLADRYSLTDRAVWNMLAEKDKR